VGEQQPVQRTLSATAATTASAGTVELNGAPTGISFATRKGMLVGPRLLADTFDEDDGDTLSEDETPFRPHRGCRWLSLELRAGASKQAGVS
jgi:hypothetical protein